MPINNQDLPVRSYQKQFKEMLQTVFASQAYFTDFFSGGLEALDGVSENTIAFSVKTSDIPVVVGANYDTTATVAFGTGTGNSNRFGSRTEITYTSTDVPYTWGWSYHEGIDRFTVNNALDAAVADRLELQARAKTDLFNTKHSAFIAASAGGTVPALASYGADDVLALFDALYKYFINIKAVGNKVAKVNADLFNAIVNHPLTINAKESGANIDTNSIMRFKDFGIEACPDILLTDGTNTYAAYVYITGIGKAFTGINTARTINSEDFDGVALQGAGKAGEFILDDNKKAIVAVAVPPAA